MSEVFNYNKRWYGKCPECNYHNLLSGKPIQKCNKCDNEYVANHTPLTQKEIKKKVKTTNKNAKRVDKNRLFG